MTKDTEELNNTINQIGLIDIYITLHPAAAVVFNYTHNTDFKT